VRRRFPSRASALRSSEELLDLIVSYLPVIPNEGLLRGTACPIREKGSRTSPAASLRF